MLSSEDPKRETCAMDGRVSRVQHVLVCGIIIQEIQFDNLRYDKIRGDARRFILRVQFCTANAEYYKQVIDKNTHALPLSSSNGPNLSPRPPQDLPCPCSRNP